MWFFVQKFLVYGCLGVLIEFFFTGMASLVQKNWKLTSSSYLWMVFVYAPAALILEAISTALPWPFWCKAFVYVPVIYGIEALSGWTIKGITNLLQRWFGGHGGNVVIWEYHKSNWAPMGLINLKYAPFWLALAMAFDPISGFLTKILKAAAVVMA